MSSALRGRQEEGQEDEERGAQMKYSWKTNAFNTLAELKALGGHPRFGARSAMPVVRMCAILQDGDAGDSKLDGPSGGDRSRGARGNSGGRGRGPPPGVCPRGVSAHARLRISTYCASLPITGASPGRGASLPRGSPPVGLANNAYNKPAGGRGGGYPMQQPLGQQLQMSIGCVSCVRSSSLLRASIP